MVDFVKVDVTRNVITIQMLKPQINSVAVTILFNLPDDVKLGIVLVLGKFEDDKLVGWIVDVSVIGVDSVVFIVLENPEVDSNVVVKVEAKVNDEVNNMDNTVMLVLLGKSEVEKVVDWIVVLDVIGGDTVELVIDIVEE